MMELHRSHGLPRFQEKRLLVRGGGVEHVDVVVAVQPFPMELLPEEDPGCDEEEDSSDSVANPVHPVAPTPGDLGQAWKREE